MEQETPTCKNTRLKMIASRRKWPNFSPCNSTNSADIKESEHQLRNSSTKTFTNSELIRRWHDSTDTCPAWSSSSFIAICPPSPSPNCSSFSPYSIISCSPNSDIFYSQISTDFSTPRNKTSCTISNDVNVLTSGDEIDQEINHANDFYSFCQPHLQTQASKEAEDVEQEYSPKCWSYASEYQSMDTNNKNHAAVPLLVVKEEQEEQKRCMGSSNTDYKDGDSDSDSGTHGHYRLMSRPKPYRDFLDEIKKKENEDQLHTWKEDKRLKLMNKLQRKEASINAWELKQIKKETMEMKKIESKLERKRAKAFETLQRKISKIQSKAEEKKSRERYSTVKEISTISRVKDKIKATGNHSWLKLSCL